MSQLFFLILLLVTFNLSFGKSHVQQADILVGKLDASDHAGKSVRQMRAAVVNKSLLWKDGIIPIQFGLKFRSEKARGNISAALHEIMNKTCVRFVDRTNQADFVYITRTTNNFQCSTHEGKIGGETTMHLGEFCMDLGRIIHETMHALGLLHEHNRSDRDDFIAVIWDNIETKYRDQFRIQQTDNLGLPYDPGAVIHYGEYDLAKDPRKPTIVAKGSVKLRERQTELTVSAKDFLKINRLYGCPRPALEWTEGPSFIWHAKGCDYPGNNLTTHKARDYVECGVECRENLECGHFTWSPFDGGTCFLKQGAKSRDSAVSFFEGEIVDPGVCGYVDKRELGWDIGPLHIEHADRCDFPYNDLAIKKYENYARCGMACATRYKCTHFTWTEVDGGTCFLKQGPKTKKDAVRLPDSERYMTCGLVTPNKLGKAFHVVTQPELVFRNIFDL